jgi:hypothetical protein
MKLSNAQFSDLAAKFNHLRQIQVDRIAYLLGQLVGKEVTVTSDSDDRLKVDWPEESRLVLTRTPWRRHPLAWICRILEMVVQKQGKDPRGEVDGPEMAAERDAEGVVIHAGDMPRGPDFWALLEKVERASSPVTAAYTPKLVAPKSPWRPLREAPPRKTLFVRCKDSRIMPADSGFIATLGDPGHSSEDKLWYGFNPMDLRWHFYVLLHDSPTAFEFMVAPE